MRGGQDLQSTGLAMSHRSQLGRILALTLLALLAASSNTNAQHTEEGSD